MNKRLSGSSAASPVRSGPRPEPEKVRSPGVLAVLLPGSIGARLALLIALVLLPLAALLGWNYYQRYASGFVQAMSTELEVAHGVATTFGAYVNDVRRSTQALGRAIVTLAPPQAETRRLLTDAVTHYRTVRSLHWVSPSGKVLASSMTAAEGLDLSGYDHFHRLSAGAHWTVGRLHPIGTAVREPTFAVASAIRDDDGALAGLLVAAVDPTRLGELTLTRERPAGAYALFDGEGTLVYRSPPAPLSWEQRTTWPDTDPVLRQVLASGRPETGIAGHEPAEARSLVARVPVAGIRWVAGAAMPEEQAMGPIRRDLLTEGALASAIAVMAFLLAWMLSRTISRPLRQLEGEARGMEDGHVVDDHTGLAPTEVRSLRNSVSAMAGALLQRAGALEESQARFRQLADAMPQLVWTADPDGRVDYYNGRQHEYAGIARTGGGYQWAPTLHPDDAEATVQAWRAALATGETYQAEHRVQKRDGTYRWHLSRAVPVRDWHGRIRKWFGTATDIDDVKTAEAALRRRSEELQRINAELEEFAYVASHDLKAPLRAVANLALVIDEDAGAGLDDENRRRLALLRERIVRMDRLIEGLLAYARLGRSEPARRELVEVSAVLRDLVGDLDLPEGFEVIREEPLPALRADPTQLRQILQNLVANAANHHDDPPRGHVWIRAGDALDFWYIDVADDGPGIPPGARERVFKMFFTGKGEGRTGIGLAVVRKLVITNGGQIEVRENRPRGTVFRISWPKA